MTALIGPALIAGQLFKEAKESATRLGTKELPNDNPQPQRSTSKQAGR